MDVHGTIAAEREFHDRQAQDRAESLRAAPEALLVSETRYLDHEPWIRPALTALGEVRDRQVLDFGCGHGMMAVVLGKRGARVTAFDLSGGYLEEARARARINGVAVNFVQANGETLPFSDGAFDLVWGNAVLHHLSLERAGPELRRVLRPGGRAVFCEPWGGNPFLNWARRRLPYPGKARTRAEAPLTAANINVLRGFFPNLEVTGYQLFSMVGRVLKAGVLVGTLAWLDGKLLTQIPRTQRWCRYVVLSLGPV